MFGYDTQELLDDWRAMRCLGPASWVAKASFKSLLSLRSATVDLCGQFTGHDLQCRAELMGASMEDATAGEGS